MFYESEDNMKNSEELTNGKKTGCQEGKPKTEGRKPRGQEDKQVNKSCHTELNKANRQFCHPELDSGSKNCRVSLYPSGSSGSVHLTNQIDRFRIRSGMTNNKYKDTDLLPSCLSALLPKKIAFTLAEVLITLGIIGVVAAMTIPTMMSNYRKHVVESKLVKFYSTINQAIRLAEVDYGDRTGWDYLGSGYVLDENGDPTDEPVALAWAQKYLMPYLKGDVKLKNSSGNVEIYFQDGSLLTFQGTGWMYYIDAAKYKLDEENKPTFANTNLNGTMVFTFYFRPDKEGTASRKFTGKGVEPYKYAWDGKRETLFTNDRFGCKKEATRDGHAYCAALIQQNGWKIPKDYPLKF